MRLSVGIKLGFWLALLGALSTALTGYYVYDRSRNLLIAASQEKLLASTHVLARHFSASLGKISADVRFVAELPLLREIVNSPAAARTGERTRQLEDVFAGLLATRSEYSQIRLIGTADFGREVIRVDRLEIGIQSIRGSELQEKNHVPYFYETLRLAPGQYYVSPISLNQELGANYGYRKPTLRIATPLNTLGDTHFGILVVDVNLEDMFKLLSDDIPRDVKVLLANQRGDYLIHPDPAKAFGFDQGRPILIQDDLPAIQNLLDGKVGQTVLESAADALFSGPSLAAFVRTPFDLDGKRFVMLGLYTPLDAVLAESRKLEWGVLQLTLGFIALATLIALLLAKVLAKPLNEMARTLREHAPGQMLAPLPVERDDEVGDLAKSFHGLAQRENVHGRVLDMLSRDTPLADVLKAIVLGVEEQNPALLCSILLVDEDGRHLRTGAAPSLPDFYNTAIDGAEIADGAGSCGTAIHRGARVIVDDVATHPYWAAYRDLTRRARLGSCWSEPVRGGNGKVLGSFAIYHRKPSIPSEDDLRLIEQNAGLAGLAIERSRNADELRLAAMVYQHSAEAMLVTDADNRIIAINPAFTELTGYTVEDVLGRNPRVLASGRHDATFYQGMWATLLSTGQWHGEIWNRHRDGSIFAEALSINTITNADGSVFRRVSLFHDITQKKMSEELIWKQANFDPQTGLPNRRMFHDRLDQELKKAHRTGLPIVLMFIDLDRFKEVNDTLGHDMGDLLLQEAARRLTGCVRDTDTVARMGGDEFMVILGEFNDPDGVERVAQTILRSLGEPFQLGDDLAYLSASIGITVYPEDASSVDALLKNADQAMYAAKARGRNRYSYFTSVMQDAAQARMRLTNDLRTAIQEEQFELYYQPIVDLADGSIRKAEALIRWHHPTRGLVPPDDFIPIAEDTGLIVDIGNWVFYEAARQVARWRTLHHPKFQISVNKSPVQFRAEDAGHDAWFDHLAELSLSGQSMVVEITEGLLLDASPSINEKLLRFRDAGMQVSLDDFGTGYSSLAYLKKFDIDYLKIDRSFVRNLAPESEDMAICEAMIVMAHKLGMRVIAEGVETVTQRDLLAVAGCDFGQGYLFARPVPAVEFERLLGMPATDAPSAALRS